MGCKSCNSANSHEEGTKMIDPDTIDDIDEVDGEEVFCHGYDPSVKEWKWDWVPYDHLADAGRSDIIERVWGG